MIGSIRLYLSTTKTKTDSSGVTNDQVRKLLDFINDLDASWSQSNSLTKLLECPFPSMQ
jgi:hypothetical protein